MVQLVLNAVFLVFVCHTRGDSGSKPPFVRLTDADVADTCEGVLIGNKQVLTVTKCHGLNSVSLSSGETDEVESWITVGGSQFLVVELEDGFQDVQLAVLSWFGENSTDLDHNIKPEMCSKQDFRIGQSALSWDKFWEGGSRAGAALYKYPDNLKEYVVFGLVNEDKSSGYLLRIEKSDIEMITSLDDNSADLRIQRRYIPEGTSYIPDKATIGTFNMQGFIRMKRDMGDKVLETWINIFQNADIVSLQETSDTSEYQGLLDALKVQGLAYEPRPSESYGLGFVYKENRVIADDCKSHGGPVWVYHCNFTFKGNGAQSFRIYNIHLKAGYGSEAKASRKEQIEQLRTIIKKTSGDLTPYLIAGDMNTNDANEYQSLSTELPEVRHHDPGITTPAGKHYDRILVSENLRLTHYFSHAVSPGASKQDIERMLSEDFFPPLNYRNNPKCRNYELSDHLPLHYRYHDSDMDVTFGTWNVEKKLFQNQSETACHQYYKDIFNLYHVIALQEISPEDNYREGYNRFWKLSESFGKEKLAFAYDAGTFEVQNCSIIPINKTRKNNERGAYCCQFKLKKNGKTVVLANVHIVSPGNFKVVESYKKAVEKTFGTTRVFILGDFNFQPLQKFDICTHNVSINRNSHWSFTAVDSKKVLDYIWNVENEYPGVPGCKVLNPELMKIDQPPKYLIESDDNKVMKYFGRWKEISDHYPVFMTFKRLKTGRIKRERSDSTKNNVKRLGQKDLSQMECRERARE
jgi:endonuclease/exonuclease/phosphatase family metal-dependent hydrolase